MPNKAIISPTSWDYRRSVKFIIKDFNTLHCGYFFFSFCWFIFRLNFFINFPSECQTDWVHTLSKGIHIKWLLSRQRPVTWQKLQTQIKLLSERLLRSFWLFDILNQFDLIINAISKEGVELWKSYAHNSMSVLSRIWYFKYMLSRKFNPLYKNVFFQLVTGPVKQKKKKRKIAIIFLSISLNMCFGCSKEPSHRDGSFEYPQHMFWLRNKKNNIQWCTLIWRPVWSYAIHLEWLIIYIQRGQRWEFRNCDVQFLSVKICFCVGPQRSASTHYSGKTQCIH